jgi:hypothetical protein
MRRIFDTVGLLKLMYLDFLVEGFLGLIGLGLVVLVGLEGISLFLRLDETTGLRFPVSEGSDCVAVMCSLDDVHFGEAFIICTTSLT